MKRGKLSSSSAASESSTHEPAEIRARVARIVAQVADHGQSLDALLSSGESTPSRGLTRSLAYGTLRWHGQLAHILSLLSARPIDQLDDDVRALALVGLFQILHTDIAEHAAVAETVEAVRHLRRPKAAGLVNAMLRRCQRERASLLNAVEKNLALRTSHPQWLVDALKIDWPDRYETILTNNNLHPPMWLRVNARKTTRSDYLGTLRAQGMEATSSLCAPDALLLEKPVDVRQLPGFDAGLVSVQDAAAQLAARLLELKSGQRVLDACAAPGGKTCHMLELNPEIDLIAIDIAPARLRRIQENLERLGLSASLVAGNAGMDNWWDGRKFDRILLDVPCSATGVIRRHPDIKLLRRESDIDALVARQKELLAANWARLLPGGRLVYASCSALRSENAAVIGDFLSTHPDAADVTSTVVARQIPSHSDLHAGPGPGLAIPAGAAQMDGFYYACLDKVG